jgi:hypothetical protein
MQQRPNVKRLGPVVGEPAIALEQFRNWCRPDPDFLWSFMGPPNCMRLSAKKAAHHFSQLAHVCHGGM